MFPGLFRGASATSSAARRPAVLLRATSSLQPRTFILVPLAVGTSLNLAVGSGQLASRATRTGCVMMWYCTSCSRGGESAVAVGLAACNR